MLQRSEPLSEGMEQINRLMERVARLYQEGRYKQAFAVAQQACDLTRREVGARHPLFAASPNNLALLYHDMGDLAAAPGTILAFDLGKYKSVACLYDRATAAATFDSIPTSRGELLRLIDRHRPSPPSSRAASTPSWPASAERARKRCRSRP
jgi:hypothetical protein